LEVLPYDRCLMVYNSQTCRYSDIALKTDSLSNRSNMKREFSIFR